MVSSFVIGSRASTFDIVAKKFSTKYSNINILMGPKAGIEGIKEEINKFTAGFTFETQWREMPND